MMTALRTVVVIVFCAAIAASSAPMEFATLAQGDESQIDEPRQVVVRTADEWAALWKEHSGAAQAPVVDFAGSMVIGVFAGSRPTAGYAVEVTRIERQDDGLVVTYRERAPAPDAIVAQVLTAPFHIVRTRREPGPVRFTRAR